MLKTVFASLVAASLSAAFVAPTFAFLVKMLPALSLSNSALAKLSFVGPDGLQLPELPAL